MVAFHGTGILFLSSLIDLEKALLGLWHLNSLTLFELVEFPTDFHV